MGTLECQLRYTRNNQAFKNTFHRLSTIAQEAMDYMI